MKTVSEKLHQMRICMKKYHMSAYIVCTNDFHGSEYVGAYFRTREYLSGFTGSAGTLVITERECLLWTDGRYFLQAESELCGTEIKLMKQGQEGFPDIEDYLYDFLKTGDVIGFDGRTVSIAFVNRLKKKLDSKQISYKGDKDVADEVWDDRPAMSKKPVWLLDDRYTGSTCREKLARIREKMKACGADYFVVTALDEIAWITNLRGNDVKYNPVFLSYLIVGRNKAVLYLDEKILQQKTEDNRKAGFGKNIEMDIMSYLQSNQIQIRPYDSIYGDLAGIHETGKEEKKPAEVPEKSFTEQKKISAEASTEALDKTVRVLLDFDSANDRIMCSLNKRIVVINRRSPVMELKAVKNKVECENIRAAHLKDGVAVTRFIYWLKQNVGKQKITELDAAAKLQQFRREQKNYIEDSFATIAAYGPHGAIVHYEPTEKTDIPLKKEGLLLVDSGAHYLEGTTDVTRTIALGKLSKKEKQAYTLVLSGHLRLGAVMFLYGTRGENLDYVAREPLWKQGLDYHHGTGHGVGNVLNVHEGPNKISWKLSENRPASCVLEEGMITSNEPGFYLAGEFGIRHESLVLCRKNIKNEYGQFMSFETLTYVPFDREAVDKNSMTKQDIELFNRYQQNVYKEISPYLEEAEKNWLYEETREL